MERWRIKVERWFFSLMSSIGGTDTAFDYSGNRVGDDLGTDLFRDIWVLFFWVGCGSNIWVGDVPTRGQENSVTRDGLEREWENGLTLGRLNDGTGKSRDNEEEGAG